MELNWYRQRWLKLWKAIGAKGDAEVWFGKIISEWIKPERVYHGVDHLGEGLIEFETVRHLFDNPLLAELTWWLHDVIYDPHKALGENERLSADFAIEFLSAVGLAEKHSHTVEKMIMASQPGKEPYDNDSSLLLDIDIIRLAAPAKRFWKISAMVRDEYSFVPEDTYNRNRALVLGMFIDRPTIFYTKRFQKKYEAQANRNITAALKKLE